MPSRRFPPSTCASTIAAATHSGVAVRFLCANTRPEPDSIGAFRRENQAALEAAFVTVPPLAHQLKLTPVGTVSVDGTKIHASASKHPVVRRPGNSAPGPRCMIIIAAGDSRGYGRR
jgi:transposase